MSMGLYGGSLSGARRGGTVIAIGGDSNTNGFLTGARWKDKPASVAYWSTKTGSLALNGEYPTDPGISLGMIDELVNVLGHASALTVVEHAVNGTGLQTWQTPAVGEALVHLGHLATVGVRPTVLVLALGTNDAQSPAQAAAAAVNVMTTIDRYRAVYGANLGVILVGLHIRPSAGVTSDLDLVDNSLYGAAIAHVAKTCIYINNRDIPCQSANDHLTGQPPPVPFVSTADSPGGSDTVGRRVARLIHQFGLIA